MALDPEEAFELLRRTPAALRSLLQGLPDPWLDCDEGPDTFAPRDVVVHLIHGERTDWIVRARLIVEHGSGRPFEPFDRYGAAAERSRPLAELLDELETLREANLEEARRLTREPTTLGLTGMHPALGSVTLGQLVAAWAVHDLTHIAQIARVMARRYSKEVGPWERYLGVLQWRRG